MLGAVLGAVLVAVLVDVLVAVLVAVPVAAVVAEEQQVARLGVDYTWPVLANMGSSLTVNSHYLVCLAFPSDSWLETEAHLGRLGSIARQPIFGPNFPCKRHD